MAADERPRLGWYDNRYTATTNVIGTLQEHLEAAGFIDTHPNLMEYMGVMADFQWYYTSEGTWNWATLRPLNVAAELWLLANLPASPE